MTLPPELKEAVLNLPTTRKDKLLLRLLRKDPNLVEQLYFELVEDRTQEELREEMVEFVKEEVQSMTHDYYSPGYLHTDMRYLSGSITEHVRTTKDRFGEVSLNLLMLNKVLELNTKRIVSAPPNRSKKLLMYILNRTFKILMLINKMHEDVLLDFEDDLAQLGRAYGKVPPLMNLAIFHGFDANWLFPGNIPENIAEIHRDLKQQGYLR